MAIKSNITRRTALTGLASLPLAAAAVAEPPTTAETLENALGVIAKAMNQMCQGEGWRVSIGRCWKDGKIADTHYYQAVRIRIEMDEATTSTGHVRRFPVERHETLGQGVL